jgi:hypothetical protein
MRRLSKLVLLVILVPVLLASCAGMPQSGAQNSAAAQEASPSASPSAVTASPAPTDWHSGVKTDYSGLTPYVPVEEVFTRLSEKPLPELKPSDYGKLIPYMGKVLYDDSGFGAYYQYGLMTEKSVIVTDPVYSYAYQGSYYDNSGYNGTLVPALDLEKLSDKIDKKNPWESIRHAVCALDGSWVTEFDYSDVGFTDKVIIATRDYDANDIDILDYSGRLLYNSKSLNFYDLIPPQSAYIFKSGYGEGLFSIPLSNGETVFFDAATGGSEIYVPYKEAGPFISGFAHVTESGLTGFINRDYQPVIEPKFSFAGNFYEGQNIVQLPDSSYAVIDSAGTILFKSPRYIYTMGYDELIYAAEQENSDPRYYDSTFKELKADGKSLKPLYNGWFYYDTPDGVVLRHGDRTYPVDGVTQVLEVAGGVFSYTSSDSGDTWAEGVRSLDGKEIVPLTKNVGISLVETDETGAVLIAVSAYEGSQGQEFRLMDGIGKTLASGTGNIWYDSRLGLFSVFQDDSFGYIDRSGKYVFRISLLQYVPD